MFIIAGISPRIKILDNNPRICPVCGLAQAYLKRADNYLSLFFIPLFRVKKGEPFLICERCENLASGSNIQFSPRKEKKGHQCKTCGKTLGKDFMYCPYCGKRM
ncbi:MAG: zinc ribbon domain-containing protein [Deltaproteobacteria bacterium]|nr:zinc ribbon domain-containing protein [Deltaproteobacteria bacterium]